MSDTRTTERDGMALTHALKRVWNAIYNSFVEWSKTQSEAERLANANLARALEEATAERLELERAGRLTNPVDFRILALKRAQRW